MSSENNEGPKVKLVIVASSFSKGLSQEIHSRDGCAHLLNNQTYVHKALLKVGGQALLQHWIDAAEQCPRLQPLANNVYVLCNANNRRQVTAWAAGRPGEECKLPTNNILCNNESQGHRSGVLKDTASAIRQINIQDEHLVVVDADCLCEPHFTLERFIEHSLIRSKDIVSISTPVPGMSLHEHVQVVVDNPTSCNPKVASIGIEASTAEEASSMLIAGPVYFFHRTTVPEILSVADLETIPAWKQIGIFLKQRCSSGKPLYALPVSMNLSVRTLDGFLVADGFFHQCSQDHAEPDAGDSEEAPRITAGTLLGTGPVPKAEQPDSRVLLLQYLDMYHGARTQQFSKPQQGRTLPERFTGQLQWTWNKQQQHPVYTTTSSTYGAKAPAVQEMPNVWNGVKGQFTQQFSEPYKNMGLKTSMTPSKVHTLLDC